MAWDTVVVAGLGIVGTLIAATLTSVVMGKLARRDRRVAIYAETLAGLWRAHENAQTLSAVPGADLSRPPIDRLRQLDAETRLVAGRRVREQLQITIRLVNRFEQEFFIPQLHARTNPDENSSKQIQERMAIGTIADELGAANQGTRREDAP